MATIQQDWRRILYREFEFLGTLPEGDITRPTLIYWAREIQELLVSGGDPISSVFESSLWGYAQAYREFTGDLPMTLDTSEIEYVRGRSGILGSFYNDQDEFICVSFMDIWNLYDPSFCYWLYQGNFGPPAF